MNLDPKIKKVLSVAAAVIIGAAVLIWLLLNPGPEHIEDTNGAENYTLQSIRESDIVSLKLGSRGGVSTRKTGLDLGAISISDGIEYSSNKFTGVYELYSCHLFKGSDILIDLADYRIESGNFAFYVVFNGEIIGTLTPDEFGTAHFLYENADKSGTLQYIIAGESADFTFISATEW